MTIRERSPVAESVAGVAVLLAVLVVLAYTVPMSVTAEHSSRHLAMGLPLLVLLVLAYRTWPRPEPSAVSWLARGTLLAGLAVAGAGLLAEAVGAFGYEPDGYGRASSLADLHAAAVTTWPIGFVLLLVGTLMTVGVLLSARLNSAVSRVVIGVVVLAGAAAVTFIASGFILGY